MTIILPKRGSIPYSPGSAPRCPTPTAEAEEGNSGSWERASGIPKPRNSSPLRLTLRAPAAPTRPTPRANPAFSPSNPPPTECTSSSPPSPATLRLRSGHPDLPGGIQRRPHPKPLANPPRPHPRHRRSPHRHRPPRHHPPQMLLPRRHHRAVSRTCFGCDWRLV